VVQREHDIDQIGIRFSSGLQLLGIVISRQWIDHWPSQDDASHAGVYRRRSRWQGDGSVARVTWSHRAEDCLMRATGTAEHSHHVWPAAELCRPCLEPADRIIDVSQ